MNKEERAMVDDITKFNNECFHSMCIALFPELSLLGGAKADQFSNNWGVWQHKKEGWIGICKRGSFAMHFPSGDMRVIRREQIEDLQQLWIAGVDDLPMS